MEFRIKNHYGTNWDTIIPGTLVQNVNNPTTIIMVTKVKADLRSFEGVNLTEKPTDRKSPIVRSYMTGPFQIFEGILELFNVG